MPLRICTILVLFLQPFTQTPLEGQILPKDQMKEDLDVFIEAYEHHPGLYLYRTEAQIDSVKQSLKNIISDSISIDSFYLTLLESLVFLKDGHTGLSLGRKYSDFERSKKTLPFKYKIMDDRLYVVDTLVSGLGDFMYSELLSVNEIPIDSILERFFTYTTSDNGNEFYIRRYNERIFGQNFDFFFDGGNEYSITAIANTGDTINKRVFGIEDFEQRASLEPPLPVSSKFDRDNDVAVLTVNTFIYRRIVDSGIHFHKEIESFFKKVRQKGIENVVIDLRENYGGSSALAMTLYAYLAEEDFKWIDHSYTLLEGNENFAKFSQYQDGLYPFLKRHKTTTEGARKKLTNGVDSKPSHSSTHIPFGPKMKIKNISKDKFRGDLYILTSGMTFSAGSIFVSKCSERKKTTIIGESPGSASGVFCAGGYLNITLPNSGFRFNLPTMLRHVAISAQSINPRAPIVPDYLTVNTIDEIRDGIDVEIKMVYQLLLERSKE